MSSTILGLNFVFHDSAACVLRDGRLVAAIEEERLNRVKHTQAFPRLAIGRCLAEASVSVMDVTDVAVSVLPGLHERDKLEHAARLGASREAYLDHEFGRLQRRLIAFWEWFHASFDHAPRAPRVHFVEHHLAHLGGYWASGYEAAALLSVDGRGEWSTAWLGSAEGREVECLGQSHFPHSLGMVYSAATQFCGFVPNCDEGKTMGLAPTGDPERFHARARELVGVDADGRLRVDTGAFAFQEFSPTLFAPRFEHTFGPRRREGEPIAQRHRDVAAAFQRVLEECVLALCDRLHGLTGQRRLVLSGGVALNAVANGRILRESAFEDLHVVPGAGDGGTCVGAAHHVYHAVLGHGTRWAQHDPYLGTAYGDDDVEAALAAAKLPRVRTADACAEAARRLAAGEIVGWFQGAMEFGPCSLGNRSILADPRRADVKERVNAEVKRREPFRPFAPSVPVEEAAAWFELGVESPYMLKACPVREDRRALVPGVTHVDGSARVQTVDARANPRFHELLSRFGAETGVPVLLNTSFNAMGEPIVESPLDALRCFFSTGIDTLFLGDFVVEKRPASFGASDAAGRDARRRAAARERGAPEPSGALDPEPAE